VRWDIVKQPVSLGGLGVRDLRLFNESLLEKWFWRFLNEKGSLWREVVVIKYGSSSFGWYPTMPNGAYDAVFGDLSLNVGGNSLLTFPLRLVMV